MSALSEATAVRRSLIESIYLTLYGYSEETNLLSDLGSEELTVLAEAVADNLIDGDWVTEEPSA